MPIKRLLLPLLPALLAVAAFAQTPNEDLIAATKRGDAAAVKAALDKGAQVNARTNYGATALHFAADRGHVEVIKLLLAAGADANAKDEFYKFTPLMMAMMHQRKEAAELLQAAAKAQSAPPPQAPAAPPTTPPPPAAPPAKLAQLNEELLDAARKGDAATVKSLLAKGAEVNAKTRYNQTPLMLAAGRGHLEVVKHLADAGADLNVVDSFYKGVTALSAAAEKGYVEIVRLLLGKGAKGKEDALFQAVFGNHPAVVKAVIEVGEIALTVLNNALARAEENERTQIVELLRGAGAKPPERKALKPAVAVDAATLQRYAGTYRLDEARQYTFIVQHGKLNGWDVRQYSFALTAIERNVFRIGDNDDRNITFNLENDRIVSITVTQSGFKQTYNRVEGK